MRSSIHKPYGEQSEPRERAGQWNKQYQTYRWKQIRKNHLKSEPLCRMCLKDGITRPASICDHIEPHRGNMVKFWNGPFQSLCKQCHDSKKQAFEKSGKIIKKIGVDGYPI